MKPGLMLSFPHLLRTYSGKSLLIAYSCVQEKLLKVQEKYEPNEDYYYKKFERS